MQSKEKRKTNPRRPLLMRLIVVIVAIAIILLLGLRALKPTGAQIVYIAPDENGYDAIWLADLNDPENPRQLTHQEYAYPMINLVASTENSTLHYALLSLPDNRPADLLWYHNIVTGQNVPVPPCIRCQAIFFRPTGGWSAYLGYEDGVKTEVYVYNLETGELRIVYEIIHGAERIPISLQPFPSWVGNTGLLIFRLHSTEEKNRFALYSPEDDEIIDVLSLEIPRSTPNFSDDGSMYYYYLDVESTDFIRFYNRENPHIMINEINMTNRFVSDWHDNYVLLKEISNSNNDVRLYDLNLFDLVSGEIETLISDSDIRYSGFNADATQILYSMPINNSSSRQLMLFDMETREEITLPIVGRDPQWVNGGR